MTAQRRVRSLRLAAPDERLVRRGAFLVEDALGTASLPWADAGRLVLIRALDLGRFGAAISPSGLALRVERRMRELASSAVHALDPAAPRSPAVFFRDTAEAHGLLAARLARGEDASAWFWRSAVPAWRPETPRSEALRVLLFSALDNPARVSAVVELVRGLGRDLETLLEALLPEDGPALLLACGWSGIAWIGEERTGLVARWISRWGARDARSAWLAAVMKAVERPGLAGDPHLPSRPSPPGPLSRLPDPLPGRGGDLQQNPVSSPMSMQIPEIRQTEENRTASTEREEEEKPSAIESTTEMPAFLDSTPALPTAPAPATARKSPPLPGRECSGDRERGPGGEGSAFAGLYFLLPVLAHLGLPGVLRDQPHLLDLDLPARVLDRLAERLGALPEDPVRAALLLPEETPGGLQDLLDAWITDARRWCRRRARIGLFDLVRRPGLVSFTPTHVDIVLDIRRIDLRVRRAGLDLDPGWLPWLGRVVTFHYERLEAAHGG